MFKNIVNSFLSIVSQGERGRLLSDKIETAELNMKYKNRLYLVYKRSNFQFPILNCFWEKSPIKNKKISDLSNRKRHRQSVSLAKLNVCVDGQCFTPYRRIAFSHITADDWFSFWKEISFILLILGASVCIIKLIWLSAINNVDFLFNEMF